MDTRDDVEYRQEFIKKISLERKREQGELAADLDLVQIDGRWAQILLGGDAVHYFDDGSQVAIDWDEYNLVRKIQVGLINLDLFAKDIQFPQEFIDKIHWEQTIEGEDPNITRKKRMNIHVFGIFEKK